MHNALPPLLREAIQQTDRAQKAVAQPNEQIKILNVVAQKAEGEKL